MPTHNRRVKTLPKAFIDPKDKPKRRKWNKRKNVIKKAYKRKSPGSLKLEIKN